MNDAHSMCSTSIGYGLIVEMVKMYSYSESTRMWHKSIPFISMGQSVEAAAAAAKEMRIPKIDCT